MSETTEQNSSETKPGRKPAGARRWILAVLALILVGGAIGYWRYSQQWESTDDAQIDARLHRISARVSAAVIEVAVEDNQQVKAGDVLVKLDPSSYQVAVDHAQAAVAQAEADAAAVRAGIGVVSTSTSTELSGAEASLAEVQAAIATAESQASATHARLPVAEAAVRQAQANYDQASGDVARYQALVDKEEISRQQFDAATAAAAATKAQLDAAEAQRDEVQRAIDAAEAEVTQAKARLARAESDVQSASSGPEEVAASRARAKAAEAKIATEKANLAQAEIDLKNTVIRAPVDGVVRRDVEVGQSVQIGQPVATVVSLDDVWAVAHFKESQLANIRPGQSAEVAVDAYGGRTYQGHVDSVSPATGARFSLLPPENATGNYVKVVQRVTVKIVFDEGQDPEHLLRPGMSVVPKVRVQ